MTKTNWLNCGDVIVTAFAEYRTGSEEAGYTKHKDILSKTVIYQDWDSFGKHIKDGMKLYKQLCRTYQSWPDGEVTVSITINESCVNL